MKSKKRKLFTYILLVIIIAMITLLLIFNGNDILFAVDFSKYWSASRLTLAGANPYSSEAIMASQLEIGWPYDFPMMMYNPPWTLSLVLPVGLLPYNLGRIIWLIFSILLYMLSRTKDEVMGVNTF